MLVFGAESHRESDEVRRYQETDRCVDGSSLCCRTDQNIVALVLSDELFVEMFWNVTEYIYLSTVCSSSSVTFHWDLYKLCLCGGGWPGPVQTCRLIRLSDSLRSDCDAAAVLNISPLTIRAEGESGGVRGSRGEGGGEVGGGGCRYNEPSVTAMWSPLYLRAERCLHFLSQLHREKHQPAPSESCWSPVQPEPTTPERLTDAAEGSLTL